MSDTLDLTKLTDAQLGALKMVGGDVTKLPDKMLSDISATLGSSPAPSTTDKVMGGVNAVVNTVGTGLTKGVTGLFGLGDTVGELGKRGAEWVGEKAGFPETGKTVGRGFKDFTTLGGLTPSAEGLNDLIFNKAGVPEVNAGDNPALTIHPGGSNINLGKMIDSGIQAVPSMLGGGVASAIPGFAGGVTSEAAGQATAGTPWEFPARILAGFGGYKAGQRAVTPLPANLAPEEARLVQLAKEKDIPMTVGQETGRGRAVESALSRFPTSQGKMAEFADTQNTAINREALKSVGEVGDRLDPTTMNSVIKSASNKFETAKNASGDVKLDTAFFQDLNKTITSYLDNTPAAAVTPSVTKRAADFVNQPGHTLTGEQYQEFRRTLNEASQSVTDVGAARALRGMRNALDDAMGASLPADQAQAWKDVRRNWANLKVLTKAAAGGTVDSRASGDLSPSALSMALRSQQGADRFSSTTGGLNDTARIAAYLADTRPNSGTPSTLAMQSMLTGGPVAGGALAGGLPGAAMAGGALAVPNIMARAMTGQGWATPAGALAPIPAELLRKYLANQAATPQLGIRGAPLALAPGLTTMRLEDRR